MVELKLLTPEAIPSALEKAKRYRLLNEPDEAESICRDILAVAPEHQEALITLLLAVTDKFNEFGLQTLFDEAKQIVAHMDTSYCKFYYTGIIFERRAKFHFKQGGPVRAPWPTTGLPRRCTNMIRPWLAAIRTTKMLSCAGIPAPALSTVIRT